MKLKITLDSNSIKAAIDELKDYRNRLAAKNELFVNRLLDEGIRTAELYVGGMGKYITFSKDVNGTTKCIGLLIAKDAKKIISKWDYYGQIVSAEVSPILMEEFGSGMYAKVLFPIDGVGRGTFPGQTHAYERMWHWKDEDGTWHSSSGYIPSHPMYRADMAMINQIEKIAREVFHE